MDETDGSESGRVRRWIGGEAASEGIGRTGAVDGVVVLEVVALVGWGAEGRQAESLREESPAEVVSAKMD